MNKWLRFKNILCIRPDNMGDVIMTGPAMRALKETFGSRITLLTSSMSKDITKHMPEIDEAIIFDMPWAKNNAENEPDQLIELADLLKQKHFDAAVIFTVYSQNPLPSAMLAYMAGIKNVLAYCRENPYGLISDWVPDKEPYEVIKHQVRRDLDLVKSIDATTINEGLYLETDENLWRNVTEKLENKGLSIAEPWVILHAGVSEKKREYPEDGWISIAQTLISTMGCRVLFTGSAGEKELTDRLQNAVGAGSYSAAGWFNLDEFIYLIKNSPFIVSVNTGTVHIAAAVGTPVVVLYAQTNPQHAPWKVPYKILEYSVDESLRSKNEVIAYVNKILYKETIAPPSVTQVIDAIRQLIDHASLPFPLPLETPNQNQATEAS